MDDIFRFHLQEKDSKQNITNKVLIFQTRFEGYIEMLREELSSIKEVLGIFDKYQSQVDEYVDILDGIIKFANKGKTDTRNMLNTLTELVEYKMSTKYMSKLNEIRREDAADYIMEKYVEVYTELLKNLLKKYDKLENYSGGDTEKDEVIFYSDVLAGAIKVFSEIVTVTNGFRLKLLDVFNSNESSDEEDEEK